MKRKIYYIFISLITLYVVIPIKVNAANGFSIGKSASTYSYNINNQERVTIGNCATTNDTTLNNYVHNCVREVYPIEEAYSSNSVDIGNGKKRNTFYFSGRVDVWGYNVPLDKYGNGYMEWKGNSGNYNWEDYEKKKYKLYPGMRFVYRRYEPLESLVGSEMVDTILYSYNTKQLKLSGNALRNLPGDPSGYYMPVSVDPANFAVENVALEEKNGTWYVGFDVRIEKLRTAWDDSNGGALLGAPGITGGHGPDTRGYHYFLPMQIDIEYLDNMCLANESDAKKFAENNPGTCCYEYPETCCSTGIPGVQTPHEFAMARPGVCCKDIPESCCNITTQSNGEPWIGSSNDDGIWVTYYKDKWQGNICCSDPTFVSRNPGKCSSVGSFLKTSERRCPSTARTSYFYTASYISLDESGNVYSNGGRVVNCGNNGICTEPITYKYTISIDQKQNYRLDTLGYSYFSYNINHNDYNEYLRQKQNRNESVIMENQTSSGIPLPTDGLAKYSLSDINFSYKISNPRIDESTERYLIDIDVTIYNLKQRYYDTPVSYNHGGNKIYFVPIKIALCWNGSGGNSNDNSYTNNTCTNMNYAKNHIEECCADDEFANNNVLLCPPNDPEEPTNPETPDSYVLDDTLTCNTTTQTTTTTSEDTVEFDNIDYINITREDFSIKASSPTVISGTGFEYPLEITDTVTYSFKMTKGDSLDNPANSKDDVINEHNAFKNILTNINKNNLSNYISSQEIHFADNRTGKDIKTIIDYDTFNKDTNYTGDLTYYYEDDDIICDCTCTPTYSLQFGYDSCGIRSCDWSESGPVNSCNSSSDKAIMKGELTDTTAVQTYTYKTKFPYAYINKNGINNENDIIYESSSTNPNESKYIAGGNKFYTNITDTTGYYNFDISIKNGGMSKKIGGNGTNVYSCGYRVLNCAVEGVCPEDTDCDPSRETCNMLCDPLSDPECMPEPSPGTSNHYFRPISLTNPFPNERDAGSNWNNQFLRAGINTGYKYIAFDKDGNPTKGESIYTREPMYEITITNQMARDIRNFNDNHSDYSSYDTMAIMNDGTCANGLCRYSKFLNSLLGVGSTMDDFNASYGGSLKINMTNRFYRIGDFETILGGGY